MSHHIKNIVYDYLILCKKNIDDLKIKNIHILKKKSFIGIQELLSRSGWHYEN